MCTHKGHCAPKRNVPKHTDQTKVVNEDSAAAESRRLCSQQEIGEQREKEGGSEGGRLGLGRGGIKSHELKQESTNLS